MYVHRTGMPINVAILGASGFVGAELLRLCAQHPELTPTRLFGDSQAGLSLAEVHPQLALAYPGLSVERFDGDAPDGIDLVFAALPHGQSQKIAGTLLNAGSRRRSSLGISSTESRK
jgi:N-acetyl-gamma-glutamyl-phosphate reductase